MLLSDLVAVSRLVAAVSGRLQKVGELAEFLKRVPPDELELAVSFLTGRPRQGRIGVGGAAVRAAAHADPANAATLHLTDVDAVFERIRTASGEGSSRMRAELLRALLARATSDEQQFLSNVIYGELRQGALEGVLIEAVARASSISAARIRRSAMLEGSLPRVARTAIVDGEPALDRLSVQLFRPVQPMLAASAEDVEQAITELGQAELEYKLDGARIQVHKQGRDVRVFSRTLRDLTPTVPDLVQKVEAIEANQLILDGEAIVLRPDGTPVPFQMTMRRFGLVSAFFFDCLLADGGTLIDETLATRLTALNDVVPAAMIVPRVVTASRDEAAAFAARALAAGHEGLVAKALGGTYAAGRRGRAWLKVKQARTLDLVVLAVEWGSGRRRGTLSNLHLGARDEERGGFVMLGKTFKGLTDDMLAWQTKALLELEVARDEYTVYVRPELVVEIAFNDVQESPHYPGRLALRFARVKRYRPDKSAAQADTFRTIREIYRQTTGFDPPDR